MKFINFIKFKFIFLQVYFTKYVQIRTVLSDSKYLQKLNVTEINKLYNCTLSISRFYFIKILI